MKVNVLKNEDGKLNVSIEGRVDTNTAAEFQSELLKLATESEGAADIIIDCSELEYTSSQGLRVFLMLQKSLNSSGGKMALVNLQPQVKEVFDITGFSNIIKIQ